MIIRVSLSTPHVHTENKFENSFDLYIPDSIGSFYDSEGKAVPVVEAITRYIKKFPSTYCF